MCLRWKMVELVSRCSLFHVLSLRSFFSRISVNLDEFHDTELENLTTYSVDKMAGKSKTFLFVGRTRSFTREKPSISWKWLWKIFVKFVNTRNRTVSAGSNDLVVQSASFLRRYFIPAPQISNWSHRTARPPLVSIHPTQHPRYLRLSLSFDQVLCRRRHRRTNGRLIVARAP